MKECGFIFNRHKWYEPTDGYRICLKCGATEYYNHYMEISGWWYIEPAEWRRKVCKLVLERKTYKEHTECIRKEILDDLKKYGEVRCGN